MIKIQINSIFGKLPFEYESDTNTIQETLTEAVKHGANLYGANLYGANLESANLRSANLRSANLYGANLRSANLRSANLYGANLESANLYGANLYGAENILGTSRHKQCMQNILFVLYNSPIEEVKKLKEKLIEGKVDGTQYAGECCCLVGTLGGGEKSKDSVDEFCSHIPFYDMGLHNLGEQRFFQIKEDDKDSVFVQEAIKCCDLFLNTRSIKQQKTK